MKRSSRRKNRVNSTSIIIFLFLVLTLFFVYYFGVKERQILEKRAAGGAVFFESFESGTMSQLPAGWTVSSSNAQWGSGWGENKGSASIINAPLKTNEKAMELIGHHATNTYSRFGMNHQVPGLGLNKTYTIQAEVFVPNGSNSQMVEVLVTGWSADFSKKFQVVDGNNLKINAALKNQWQTVSADFSFTDAVVDFSKVYVTLAVWNDQKAIFGRVSVVKKGENKIVFDSSRDGDYKVYLMNEDGSNVNKIINSRSINASFSPDGKKIVYDNSVNGGAGNIFTVNTNGTGQTQLTFGNEQKFTPVFSPNGNKILFVKTLSSSRSDLFYMNADGSGQVNLTNNTSLNRMGDISPDGQKIVFSSNRNGNNECYLMNIDGSNVQNLTNNSATDYRCTFFPTGNKILFHSNRDGNYEIYSMNIDGTNLTRLTTNSATDSYPAVSSDGQKIAFISNRDGNNEIYTMNIDGTSQVRLTNNAVDEILSVKPYYRQVGSQVASFDFSAGASNSLPSGWKFSTSLSAWGGNWGEDLGSAQIQDGIAKLGKAVEIVSHQQNVSKSTLSQICHPVTLNPTKKYKLTGDIFWRPSNWKDSPSLIIIQTVEPNTIVAKISKWESGGAFVDAAKIGSWQAPYAETDFQGLTDTSYQICARAVSGADAIFDNLSLVAQETSPTNTPVPPEEPTATPTPPQATLTPSLTPTSSPNTFSKTIIIKLNGVEKTDDVTVNAFRTANPVKINYEIVRKSDGLKNASTTPLTSTYDEATGNYSINLAAIPNDFLAPSILYLKTTKGLRVKFCSNTQTARCDAAMENASSINFAAAGNLNLTGYVLPAGDVNQDDVLNGQDIVLMIQELNKVPITSRNLQYDLDENGLVTGADYAAMLGSMTVYGDE